MKISILCACLLTLVFSTVRAGDTPEKSAEFVQALKDCSVSLSLRETNLFESLDQFCNALYSQHSDIHSTFAIDRWLLTQGTGLDTSAITIEEKDISAFEALKMIAFANNLGLRFTDGAVIFRPLNADSPGIVYE